MIDVVCRPFRTGDPGDVASVYGRARSSLERSLTLGGTTRREYDESKLKISTREDLAPARLARSTRARAEVSPSLDSNAPCLSGPTLTVSVPAVASLGESFTRQTPRTMASITFCKEWSVLYRALGFPMAPG